MINSELNDIIDTFKPISLAEMEEVKLMNRMDKKFLLPLAKLPSILQQLSSDYKVLEITNKRKLKYETIYFDTPKLDFYFDHHNKRLNRFKVRYRTYLDSNISFLEIKHKTNKGRTLKKRIKSESNSQSKPSLLNEDFLKSNTNLNSNELTEQLKINYHRMTLVHNYEKERVTLDFDLEFIDKKKQVNIRQLVIIEVKQDKNIRSKAIEILKAASVRPGGVSKYCVGMIKLNPKLKHNLFKESLNKFEKAGIEI